MSDDILVVLSTAGTEEEGARLARSLVEARLAACVNLVPGARSIYDWQGDIQDDRECLMIIKTSPEQWEELCSALSEQHSYDVPELVRLRAGASEAYESWVLEHVRGAQDDEHWSSERKIGDVCQVWLCGIRRLLRERQPSHEQDLR